MASPPHSPPAYGSSRTTGGVFRGRALGNTFNFADADDMDLRHDDQLLGPIMGKVLCFHSPVDPTVTKPDLFFNMEVVPNLGPVLQKFGRLHSPVRSKCGINHCRCF